MSKQIISDDLRHEIIEAINSGDYKSKDLAKQFNVSVSTISRIATAEKEKRKMLKQFTRRVNAKKETKMALIEAMSDYALECMWDDDYLIQKLFDCGITVLDFESCGYGSFVDEYLKYIKKD